MISQAHRVYPAIPQALSERLESAGWTCDFYKDEPNSLMGCPDGEGHTSSIVIHGAPIPLCNSTRASTYDLALSNSLSVADACLIKLT